MPTGQGAAHGAGLDGLPQIRVVMVVKQHSRFGLPEVVVDQRSQSGRRPLIDVRRQGLARAGRASQRDKSLRHAMGFQAAVDRWSRREVGHAFALEHRQRAFGGELFGVHD
ncbi:hypothetical protein D3C72_2189050 [compost metagenome]